MPKININATLITTSKELSWEKQAILTTSKITYSEDSNTLVTFNYDTQELIRKSVDRVIRFSFQKSHPFLKIELTALNKATSVPIEVEKITIEKYNLLVTYLLADEKYTYKIEVIK